MIMCPQCRHLNREGVLFCVECAAGLSPDVGSNATIPTRRVQYDPDESSAKATWGSARFAAGTTIIVHIRQAAEPLTIEPSKRVVFGRSDKTTTVKPDVDFASYGALEKGVSRQHAALEISEDTLMLLDVGSSNGTFLNGQRLPPNQPRVLRDGDEVRFGKLVTHIYFK